MGDFKDILKEFSIPLEEMPILEEAMASIAYIAEINNCDVFLDYLDENHKALVLYRQYPQGGSTLYERSAVGEWVTKYNEPAVYTALEHGITVRDIKAITQGSKTVRQDVMPIKDKNGKTIAAIVMEKDIMQSIRRTEKIECLEDTVKKLKYSLSLLMEKERDIINHIHDGMLVFDKNDILIYVNQESKKIYEELLGYHEILGMHFTEFNFCDITSEKGDVQFVQEQGNLQLRITLKNFDDGVYCVMVQNITEAICKEKELAMKESTIREINHRVKNNLQMVASILSIQSRRCESPQLKEILQNDVNRILSIGAIYQLLMDDHETVDLLEFAKKLTEHLAGIICGWNTHIEFCVMGDSIFVDGKTASNVGIILNELVTNAIKHGFAETENGKVTIALTKGVMFSNIMVQDNGKGFEQDKEFTKSIGLEMVSLLVEDKLKGRVKVCSQKGDTKVIIDFKNSISNCEY